MNKLKQFFKYIMDPMCILDDIRIDWMYPIQLGAKPTRIYKEFKDIKSKETNVILTQITSHQFEYLNKHKENALILADKFAKLSNDGKLVILKLVSVKFEDMCKKFPRLITNSKYTILSDWTIINNNLQIGMGLIEKPCYFVNKYTFNYIVNKYLKKGENK